MKKIASIALILLLVLSAGLVSSGCSSMDLVVGQVGPETVTVRDVTLYANYLLLNNNTSRSKLDASQAAELNKTALDYAVSSKVLLQKASRMGLYPLSKENQQKADDSSNQFIESLSSSGQSLSSVGMTQADLKKIMTHFEVSNLLMAETMKDVVMTDEEIRAEYDRMLTSQKDSYAADPTAYDSALSGGSAVIVYRPEGYRYIKHILIAMPKDIASQISSASSGGDTAKVAELRKQGLEQIRKKADEVLSKVQNGGDFDALVAEFGEDPGMKTEPYKSEGYQLGAKSNFLPEFLQAALALAKPGDTTGLVETNFGYHIIQYAGDVPAGPVPLEEVKSGISANMLAAKQNSEFNALVERWISETTIKKNPGKIPS